MTHQRPTTLRPALEVLLGFGVVPTLEVDGGSQTPDLWTPCDLDIDEPIERLGRRRRLIDSVEQLLGCEFGLGSVGD